ncbi:MAG TPA: hypothetical protein VJA21_26960 [Verrucomicrobiae bacterium]
MNRSPTAPSFASNQSDLARILGVSRQLVAYHCKQPGSPGRRPDGRYPVADWRDYFAAFGRLSARGGIDPESYKDRFLVLSLAFLGEHLPACVDSALAPLKLSGPKLDRAAVRLWTALAQTVCNALPNDETASVPIIVPEAIKKIAAKRKIDLSDVDTLLS